MKLVFKPWPNDRHRPPNIRPSDGEYGIYLESAHQAILVCDDPVTQMLWSRDVFIYLSVNESNRQRAQKTLYKSSPETPSELRLKSDAKSIVGFLASQGHPEALFMKHSATKMAR